jgi:DNA-binding transcriptional LysR family regulator
MNEPLDSRQLRAFVLIVKTGSFTETARRLFVTHSAISHAMASLETSVGCRLLHRVDKKVIPTEAGEALLHYAQTILAELQQARLTLKDLNQWGFHRLRLGVQSGFSHQLLAGALGRFREEFPRGVLKVELFKGGEARAALAAERCDLALGESPVPGDHLDFTPLFSDPFRIVVSSTHPWALRGRVPREELAKQPFASCSASPLACRRIERYFAGQGIVLNTTLETDVVEALGPLLILSECFTILPASAVPRQPNDRSLTVFPMGRGALDQAWGLLSRPGHSLNPAEVLFMRICREEMTAKDR